MEKTNSRLNLLQKIFLLMGIAMLIFGILTGLNQPAAVLICLCGTFYMGAAYAQKLTGRKCRMLTILAAAGAVVLAVHAVIWNYFAYGRQPLPQGEATVIVLGCKINGEEPSLMLERRLLKAKEYLELNPQASCIVSGGQGDQDYTEAHVMKKYLVENGIEEHRVYEEDLATNTDTNISNSIKLIEKEGLSDNLIVCSDGFHQLRAWMYVHRNGMDAAAISGKTPFWVVPPYAVRELAGIFKMILIG